MIRKSPSSEKSPAKILVVDDHPMVREGLAARIGRQHDLRVCGEAEGVGEALSQLDTDEFDLVVVDLSLKDGNGLDLIKRVRDRYENIKILVQSMYDEEVYGERALEAGAHGYINKQQASENVVEAVRHVLGGNTYISPELTNRIVRRMTGSKEDARPLTARLSDRELEVYTLIGQGLTTGEVAQRLHLSVHTIDTYREKLKGKLGLRNSAELNRSAVQWVLENG